MAARMKGVGEHHTQSDCADKAENQEGNSPLRPEQHVQELKGMKNLGQTWEKLLVHSEGCVPPQASLSLEVVKYSRGFK